MEPERSTLIHELLPQLTSQYSPQVADDLLEAMFKNLQPECRQLRQDGEQLGSFFNRQ